MNISGKAELTDSIRHFTIFLKSGIPIYNFEVVDTTGRETRKRRRGRRRTQTISKRHAFQANAINREVTVFAP